MKLEIKLSKEIDEPYAVIYTNEITDEISNIASLLQSNRDTVVTVKKEQKYLVLKPQDIYMVRTENKQVIVYDKNSSYASNKRLYEFENQLGKDFARISKCTIINLNKIDSVEPSLNGIMYIKLKNGIIDYISRKYLPDLKKYLGL